MPAVRHRHHERGAAVLQRALARKLGHQAVPAHPLLVMNVVFGMTVEDLSEQALAHLGTGTCASRGSSIRATR